MRAATASATGASDNAEAKDCTVEQSLMCPPDCGSDSDGRSGQRFHQILGKKELGNVSLISGSKESCTLF